MNRHFYRVNGIRLDSCVVCGVVPSVAADDEGCISPAEAEADRLIEQIASKRHDATRRDVK